MDHLINSIITVKFLNFGTQDIFAVIYLKFKQRGKTLTVFCKNGANGIANSEDPDQTAQTYLSVNLGSLRYSRTCNRQFSVKIGLNSHQRTHNHTGTHTI